MNASKPQGFKGALSITRELLAIVISIISFIISTVNVYVTNLKAPDLSLTVAPFVKQVVDNQSRNEAFFIPVTVTNRGAKPGSLVSFEMSVNYLPTGEQQVYYGQYFAQENNSELLGSFFAPMNLNGYSAVSRTVCFYPQGKQEGNFFARTGSYEFTVTGTAANVNGDSQKRILKVFRIELTQEMSDLMQSQPDGEYVFPMRVEPVQAGTLLDFLRGLWNR
ncbi:MAG: hypothetical protein AB1846_19265 [Chloroflexota bacterium]